ncbi:hypothetical protein DPMN_083752 [Dreissena polymorpha]|uniref:Uncharacterized protein n=1 Tax=Dreissena polymorpha TaxID=45954 RepID=A0A9D3YDA4_DREPO|nr:hypothetical protein DPMN_083752 [Dreissena polymorpha]
MLKLAQTDQQTNRQTNRPTDQQTGQKQYVPHYCKYLRNVNARVLTNQMWTDGQRTKTNPKTSPEQSAIFQLVQEINKTNALTKKTAQPPGSHFHDDWAKNVTSRVHVIQLTRTIFQLNSRIKETNVLTKVHENWANNVIFRVFTCFHYIHIEKNALPTGGHVFSPILLTRKTSTPTGNHTNVHEDWTLNVTSTVFKLDRDIIGTNFLTKFYEDRTINVASRVFTNEQMWTDGRQTKTSHKTSPVLKTRAVTYAPYKRFDRRARSDKDS